jgi:predicted RNase H-like HicB family nuclease
MTFGVVVEPNRRNEKIWVAIVPLLPGCSAMGSGMQDVLRKVEDAIAKYLRRRPREFPTLPPSIKCRMISQEEFERMSDAPLDKSGVLVGCSEHSLQAERA